MATRTPTRRNAPTPVRRRPTAPVPKIEPVSPPTPPEPEPTPAVARRVTIDGIEYAPVSGALRQSPGLARAGLAVTTRNRNELLERCLAAWRAHTPPDWPIIVVDDASEKPVDGADYRFDTNAGVPVAKNKCLELLMAHPSHPEHLFLADDDILPRVADWWQPYIESPEPHLAHSWGLVEVGGDDRHVAWHASGGTLLYYTREVIADVGGMRTDFGPPGQPAWGCEHVNLSDRIFNRGWTGWRYADVKNADKLFTEYDRDRRQTGHKSTATRTQREHNAEGGRDLWRARIETDTDFVEYRTDADVILTCLFTNKQAQLSGRKLKPSTEALASLADSIQHGRLVVFYDRLENPELTTGNGRPVEFVPADCTVNVFFQRWITYWRWLRDHPEVGKVWAVDGTDVTQLRDPFAHLAPGALHMGWEPVTLESSWLREHHPERRVQEFLAANPYAQVLNPGVVGGDRATLLEFSHAMMRYYFDVAIDHAQVWQPRNQAVSGAGDVPAANLVAYDRFGDRLVTGSAITTVFKAYEKEPQWSLWQHK